MTSNYFIHFGCWNRGGCPKNNELTKVMNKLIAEQPQPQFISICGDNYYPPKEEVNGKKRKYLIMDDLLSGFNCLPKDIPIYMTYGNHDYETGLFINGEKEKQCTLTNEEINIVKSNPNIHLALNQSQMFGEKTKLLFLDTTMWDEEDIDDYIQCYEKVDSKYSSSGADIKQMLIDDQKEFIREAIGNITGVDNIILIGHHPLAQWKLKKDKDGNKVMTYLILNPAFNQMLFDEIYSKLNNSVKYYYLCADLHQYQPGDIIINGAMNIRQYIVGTGGAEFDKIVKKEIPGGDFVSQDNIQYRIDLSETRDKTNGYLKCTSPNNELLFEFVTAEMSGGRRKCNTKRKRNRNRKRLTKRYRYR